MASLADAKFKTKEIVQTAKAWLSEHYADEGISDLGLEELRFYKGEWKITLGFSRKKPKSESEPLKELMGSLSLTPFTLDRVFKVITLSDKDGSVISMRNRDVD